MGLRERIDYEKRGVSQIRLILTKYMDDFCPKSHYKRGFLQKDGYLDEKRI